MNLPPSSPFPLCAKQVEPRRPRAWRLILDGPLPGAENMAKDLRLLSEQDRPGAEPTLRFFRWAQPTVSHGRLQDRAAAEALARAGGATEVVVRPTGGGRVFHRSGVSFSLVWRRDNGLLTGGVKDVYCAWHGAVAGFFREEGLEAILHKGAGGGAPGDCFEEPVEADVMWRGRKVIGGALRVTRAAWLYQGDVRTDLLGLTPDSFQEKLVDYLERTFFMIPARRSSVA